MKALVSTTFVIIVSFLYQSGASLNNRSSSAPFVDGLAERKGLRSVSSFFVGEYETIKRAAERNNCRGDLFFVLLAIRKAENGRKGLEFGIMHPRAKNTCLDTQAGWAAATVVKNYKRWLKSDKRYDFITFLGRRYCPVGAANDPTGLNKNWIKNVKYWYRKLYLYKLEQDD